MNRSLSLCLFFSSLPLAAGELQILGRQLFFDKRLSADNSISCASCHRPDRAFTDGSAVSQGIHGQTGKYNSPTVLNRAKSKRHFWDGRAATLEEQAAGPLLNPVEMGNTREELEAKLNGMIAYRLRFARAFGSEQITLGRIARALAAYEKTLRSRRSLYDDYLRGRRKHWTPDHELGRQIFFGTAGCAACHNGPNFTNDALVPDEEGKAWKVPSLRELTHTAPYFHDGRHATLRDVLEHHGNTQKLDGGAKQLLILFLESLSGDYSR
jgi:cytochrome c peroxidase